VLWKGIKRSYSIASTSNQSDIKLVIKNFPNGKMSQYWFNESKVDDLLRIEIPKGTFFLRNHPYKENIIFLANGTGIAPLKSIIESDSNQQKLGEFSRIIILWGLK
jgi:CDP-4-dehydro-6-deoxyglucose reductase, E3